MAEGGRRPRRRDPHRDHDGRRRGGWRRRARRSRAGGSEGRGGHDRVRRHPARRLGRDRCGAVARRRWVRRARRDRGRGRGSEPVNLRLTGAKALPEDDLGMRIAVAAAVEIGLLAVVAQGVLSDRTALLALVLAPIGYVVSYRRRAANNVAIKVVLACGLFVATARFLGQIGYVTSP